MTEVAPKLPDTTRLDTLYDQLKAEYTKESQRNNGGRADRLNDLAVRIAQIIALQFGHINGNYVLQKSQEVRNDAEEYKKKCSKWYSLLVTCISASLQVVGGGLTIASGGFYRNIGDKIKLTSVGEKLKSFGTGAGSVGQGVGMGSQLVDKHLEGVKFVLQIAVNEAQGQRDRALQATSQTKEQQRQASQARQEAIRLIHQTVGAILQVR